jgi:tRNA nucleotidyltransferase (CCA-adding enzyme)
MPLGELPAERIWGEIEKALLGARRPSIAFRLLAEWDQLRTIAPELVPLATTLQDPEWHPEGDVWTHTLLVIDEARTMIDELDLPRRLAVMLGALCHDLGKPATTAFEDGRIRSRGHEEAGIAPTESLLDRFRIHTREGYDVRGQVIALVRDLLKPGMLYRCRDEVSDGAIRRLARRVEADLLYRVARADCLGRTGDFPPTAMEWFRGKAQELAVERSGPEPFLLGRDLLALGLEPGRRVGEILRLVYERQLDGAFEGREAALAYARSLAGRG